MEEHTIWLIENYNEVLNDEALLIQFLMHFETHRFQMQEKMAQVPPGTSLQVPAMMGMGQGQPPPQPMQILQGTQQLNAMKQGPQGAQAPGQPAPAGSGGPPQIDPNAPSQNTPTGRQQQGVTDQQGGFQ
jgi:hypothetical protein